MQSSHEIIPVADVAQFVRNNGFYYPTTETVGGEEISRYLSFAFKIRMPRGFPIPLYSVSAFIRFLQGFFERREHGESRARLPDPEAQFFSALAPAEMVSELNEIYDRAIAPAVAYREVEICPSRSRLMTTLSAPVRMTAEPGQFSRRSGT
ncbi:MAG: hypothetical protein ABI759_12780 [Candidatus Solibacter sp.]